MPLPVCVNFLCALNLNSWSRFWSRTCVDSQSISDLSAWSRDYRQDPMVLSVIFVDIQTLPLTTREYGQTGSVWIFSVCRDSFRLTWQSDLSSLLSHSRQCRHPFWHPIPVTVECVGLYYVRVKSEVVSILSLSPLGSSFKGADWSDGPKWLHANEEDAREGGDDKSVWGWRGKNEKKTTEDEKSRERRWKRKESKKQTPTPERLSQVLWVLSILWKRRHAIEISQTCKTRPYSKLECHGDTRKQTWYLISFLLFDCQYGNDDYKKRRGEFEMFLTVWRA